jgi:hypothetical protein
VLTSAVGAFQGLPNMAYDSAVKAYVLNLGEALHPELARLKPPCGRASPRSSSIGRCTSRAG